MQTIFEIPFFHYKIDNWKETKKELLQEYSNSFLEKVENDKLAGGYLYTDYYNIVNTQEPPLYIRKTIDILNFYIDKFHSDFKSLDFVDKNFQRFGLNCAWFQKQEENMHHIVHNHGSLGFSSVCYIDYDKEKHSSTVFLSPYGEFTTGNTTYFQPEVEEGDIIFFPSFLNHFAPLNTSEDNRVIFSFNLR